MRVLNLVIMKHQVSDSVCRSNPSAWTAVAYRYSCPRGRIWPANWIGNLMFHDFEITSCWVRGTGTAVYTMVPGTRVCDTHTAVCIQLYLVVRLRDSYLVIVYEMKFYVKNPHLSQCIRHSEKYGLWHERKIVTDFSFMSKPVLLTITASLR